MRSALVFSTNWPLVRRRLAPVAWLCAAAGLAMLDPSHLAAIRRVANDALYPGQKAVASATSMAAAVRTAIVRYRVAVQTAGRRDAERRRLEKENRRLRQQVEALRFALARREREIPGSLAGAPTEPLLEPETIEARLLGQQAIGTLARFGLIELYGPSGADPGDLVLDCVPSVIDVGSDHRTSPDDLLLAGSCVWGRVARVDRWTAEVVRADAPQFRALAMLARDDGNSGWRLGPRGMLEGRGKGVCRLRFVAVTEPVEVGDIVLAADTGGLIDAPLVYGHVIEARRDAGATHWQIVVQAAVSEMSTPERLVVLRGRPNPERTALRPQRSSASRVAGGGTREVERLDSGTVNGATGEGRH